MESATNATLLDFAEQSLSTFSRELRDTVHLLEKAVAEEALEGALLELNARGRLTSTLEDAYKPLIKASNDVRSAHSFRVNIVRFLLEMADRRLRGPLHSFHGEVRVREVWNDEETIAMPAVLGIAAHGPFGLVELRMRQVIALRYWSVGFDVSNKIASALIDKAIARDVVTQLGSGLGSIWKIERKFSEKQRPVLETSIDAPNISHDFEQLVLDILNECKDDARHASLYEDYVEKTDIRVSMSEPYRRNGARVQVTLHSDPTRLAKKRASIPYQGEEMVLVSPVTLADALLSDGSLTAAEREAILGCLGQMPIGTRPERLLRIFLDALAKPGLDPRGPLASVPEEIRGFVRKYVAREAINKTSQMRAREERKPTRR